MMPGERRYKDSRIYSCFVLNRLVSEMGIDLYQSDLEGKLDRILEENARPLSKEEIKHEIKSNHYMTEKVIEALLADGHIRMDKEEGRYKIFITKEGVLHVRKFNEFYWQMFRDHITEHYKFKQLPIWFEKLK